jgi:hypothetical protein
VSYDSVEKSTATAQPFELYLFVTGNQSFFLTSADQPIVYLGNTYLPATIDRTEMEHTNEVVSGQIKIYLPPAHPVAQFFIPGLPPTEMDVTVFGGHYNDPEIAVLFSGQVASARFTDQCELICYDDIYKLQRKVPKQQYHTTCAHIFGDSGCTVNLALYTTAGVIASVNSTGDGLNVPAFAGQTHPLTGGYFRRGNDARMVVSDDGAGNITLLYPIANLKPGDACSGIAGCQLTYAACKSYNNVAHFLGFDLIPTTNPFDGSIA